MFKKIKLYKILKVVQFFLVSIFMFSQNLAVRETTITLFKKGP